MNVPRFHFNVPRFHFALADGTTVCGPVHGAGGMASDAELQRAARRSAAGKPTGLVEPKPGHVVVYPQYDAVSDGPCMWLPITSALSLVSEVAS